MRLFSLRSASMSWMDFKKSRFVANQHMFSPQCLVASPCATNRKWQHCAFNNVITMAWQSLGWQWATCWMDLQACKTRTETTRGCSPSLWWPDLVAHQENDSGVLNSKLHVALTGSLVCWSELVLGFAARSLDSFTTVCPSSMQCLAACTFPVLMVVSTRNLHRYGSPFLE